MTITADPGLLREVGDVYLAKGDRDRAIVYYHRYVAAAPAGKTRDQVAARLAELEQARATEAAETARAAAERERVALEARLAQEEEEAARRRADQRKADRERISREEAGQRRKAEEERVARRELAAHHARRERVRERRKYGWVLVGSAIGFTVGAGACVWLSLDANADIRAGLDYPSDYEDRAVDGQIWNNLGWTSLAIATVSGATGLLILRANPILPDWTVTVAPAVGSGMGISVGASW